MLRGPVWEICKHTPLFFPLNSEPWRKKSRRWKGRDSVFSLVPANLMGEQDLEFLASANVCPWHRWTPAVSPQGQLPLCSRVDWKAETYGLSDPERG